MEVVRKFAATGSWLAALAVALGAFGAHALRGKLSAPDLAIFETGVRYHLVHALALVALGLSRLQPERCAVVARLMIFGICVFAGSLYALVLLNLRWMGAITPIGGAALIASWILLAIRLKHEESSTP